MASRRRRGCFNRILVLVILFAVVVSALEEVGDDAGVKISAIRKRMRRKGGGEEDDNGNKAIKRVLKRRRKLRENVNDEPHKDNGDVDRDSRHLVRFSPRLAASQPSGGDLIHPLILARLASSAVERRNGDNGFTPYTVNADDLVPLETTNSKQGTFYGPQPEPETEEQHNKRPITIFSPSFYPAIVPAPDQSEDKTIDGSAVSEFYGNGAVSGEGGDGGFEYPEDNNGGLIQAALPVAIAGFLVLSLSSFFAGELSLNSTSNNTMPLLWQLPGIDFKGGRRKREAFEDENEIFEEDGDDGFGFNINKGPAGVGVGLHPPKSIFADYAMRFKDAMILYSMMESDSECRRKIACVFGDETRGSRHLSMITRVVKTFMPRRMDDFTRQFMRSLDDGDDGDRGENGCSELSCGKCFQI